MTFDKLTKCIAIPYVALGFVLSLAIGIEYDCSGQEMFPTYYGCPFVFKEKSLGSSMEYYYSISGLLLNVVTWSVLLVSVRLIILKLIARSGDNKVVKVAYKGAKVILICFASIVVAIDSLVIGDGFGKGLNYWYIDLNEEAKGWGMECKGELVIFNK